MRSRDPVSCPDGHLFCRECAVENLISQRNEIKRLQSDMERQMKGDEELQILENDEATVQSVKDFELLQMGLEIPNNTQWNRKLMPNGDTEPHEPITESRGMKRKFELDKEKIVRTSNEERKKVKAALSEERVRLVIALWNVHIVDAILRLGHLYPSSHHSGFPVSHLLRPIRSESGSLLS